jgi:hypothetical protein
LFDNYPIEELLTIPRKDVTTAPFYIVTAIGVMIVLGCPIAVPIQGSSSGKYMEVTHVDGFLRL